MPAINQVGLSLLLLLLLLLLVLVLLLLLLLPSLLFVCLCPGSVLV